MNEGSHNATQACPRKVASTVAAFIAALVEATGDRTMGAQQMQLLLALYENRELSQTALGKYTGVEKSANARNIDRLGPGSYTQQAGSERKVYKPGPGLVESFQDPSNRRVNLVRLTPSGRALIERVAISASPSSV